MGGGETAIGRKHRHQPSSGVAVGALVELQRRWGLFVMPVSPEEAIQGTQSKKPSARMIRSLTDYGLRLRKARSVRAARVVVGVRSASRLSWPVVIRRAVSMSPSAFWYEHGSGNRWARSTAVTPRASAERCGIRADFIDE